MIHYTLLPEKEIKTLKREYRIRLAIFLLFFMSCAVFVGTGSLVPAYVFSYSQEKETVSRLESFQKDRKDRGINEVSKSLNDINEVTNTTFGELYNNTIIRENMIKNANYNLIVKWETEIN